MENRPEWVDKAGEQILKACQETFEKAQKTIADIEANEEDETLRLEKITKVVNLIQGAVLAVMVVGAGLIGFSSIKGMIDGNPFETEMLKLSFIVLGGSVSALLFAIAERYRVINITMQKPYNRLIAAKKSLKREVEKLVEMMKIFGIAESAQEWIKGEFDKIVREGNGAGSSSLPFALGLGRGGEEVTYL